MSSSAPLLRPKKILILEEHEHTRGMMRHTLAQAGFATILAGSTAEVAALCADVALDLAIIDGSIEGQAAIGWLRMRQRGAKILVVSTEWQGLPPELAAAAAARIGADRALSKPFTFAYLAHVVHEMVGPAQTHAAAPQQAAVA